MDMGDFAIAMFADPAGTVAGLINGGDSQTITDLARAIQVPESPWP